MLRRAAAGERRLSPMSYAPGCLPPRDGTATVTDRPRVARAVLVPPIRHLLSSWLRRAVARHPRASKNPALLKDEVVPRGTTLLRSPARRTRRRDPQARGNGRTRERLRARPRGPHRSAFRLPSDFGGRPSRGAFNRWPPASLSTTLPPTPLVRRRSVLRLYLRRRDTNCQAGCLLPDCVRRYCFPTRIREPGSVLRQVAGILVCEILPLPHVPEGWN